MMSKCRKSSVQRDLERKSNKKQDRRIRFNIQRSTLQCFISCKTLTKFREKKNELPLIDQKKANIKFKPKLTGDSLLKKKKLASQGQRKNLSIFNTKLLVLQYDDDEVYTDSTPNRIKRLDIHNSKEKIKNEENEQEDDFVKSCVRVLTQETDHSSNTLPYYQSEKLTQSFVMYENNPSFPRESQRNRKSVSVEQSYLYTIDLKKIEKDGRTTIMLRNIPNKYTRDMILDEIDNYSFKKKYDFFYLPIDYQNQCNVGYGFINFIHAKFIKEFYELFHLKKWQRFNSEKICSLCYARIQGTAQLLSHFKGSNVLHQRDKRLRPLIDLNHSSLSSIVQKQKNGIPPENTQ